MASFERLNYLVTVRSNYNLRSFSKVLSNIIDILSACAGARNASDTQGFASGEAPSVILQKPSPRDNISQDSAPSVDSAATSGVARMTFSSGSKTQSGFTPDKDQDKRPEVVQQEVRLSCAILSAKVTYLECFIGFLRICAHRIYFYFGCPIAFDRRLN